MMPKKNLIVKRGQFKENIDLVLDLIRSFLRQQSLLKRKSVRFWFYTTKENIKFKLRYNVWDSAVIIEIWWLNEYLRNLKNIESNGEETIVIDIGAHIGSFSLFAATMLKNAKVLSFEPEPNNFELLKENIRINDLENEIFPFQIALAGKGVKEIQLNAHPDNLGMYSSVLLYKNLQKDKKEIFFKTKAISLEQVFEKNQLSKCDLLKIDCEGCEYSVLLSTPENILRKIRNITLEYHKGGDVDEIKQYLEQTGFKTRFDQAISNPIIGWFVHAPLLNAWRES